MMLERLIPNPKHVHWLVHVYSEGTAMACFVHHISGLCAIPFLSEAQM